MSALEKDARQESKDASRSGTGTVISVKQCSDGSVLSSHAKCIRAATQDNLMKFALEAPGPRMLLVLQIRMYECRLLR
jgi:hypothetical protein